ncbi:hypothetical protein N0V95_000857 [Ascochyta clinopodiicola]|nr:hypothetical protein N0V95_000857 [Ascochyta clinopodiicola]
MTISLMDQIYKRARKVWAWLGLAKEQTHVSQILSLLPIIVAYNRGIQQAPLESTPERPLELHQITIEYRDAIYHLFQNPWYHRVWVMQEAALAQDIVFLCGEHEVEFAVLDEAIDTENFRRWDWRTATGTAVRFPYMTMRHATLPDIRTFFRSQKVHLDNPVEWRPIRVVLLMTTNLECFAPQDRIFGMMGLLKEMDPEISSFRGNASTRDLYVDFSKYILSKSTRNHHWWKYLNMSFNLERREGLPSWVPDLHFQTEPCICTPSSIREFQRDHDFRYQASLNTSTFALGQETDEIVLRGKIIDSIIMVHPSFAKRPVHKHTGENADESLDALINLQGWESKIADAVLQRSTDERNINGTDATSCCCVTEDTYWRTLMGDNRLDTHFDVELTLETWREVPELLREFAEVVRKMQRQAYDFSATQYTPSRRMFPLQHLQANPNTRLLQSGALHPDSDGTGLFTAAEISTMKSTKLLHGAPEAFLSKLWRLAERQLFNTTHGRFGFTLRGVVCGDLVCVFNGSQTPHVVRRVEDRGGRPRYRFVGDAYVHGVMYGEADDMNVAEMEMTLV